MSLLADLLSKVNHHELKREISPNLKNIVDASAKQSSGKKKAAIFSLFFIASFLSGLLIVFFAQSLKEEPVSNIYSIAQPIDSDIGQDRQSRPDPPASSPRGTNINSKKPAAVIEEKIKPPAEIAHTAHKATGRTDKKVTVEPVLSAVNDNKDSGHAKDESGETVLAETEKIKKPAQNTVISNLNKPQLTDTAREAENKKAANDPAEDTELSPHVAEIVLNREQVKGDKKTDEEIQLPASESSVTDIASRDKHLYHARKYGIEKNYSMALSSYKKALRFDKKNNFIMNSIAYIYLTLGSLDNAIRYSRMSLNLDKDYAPALINLGIAYARTGNHSMAEEYLKHAIDLEPENRSALMNLAILSEGQKQFSSASRYFSRLIKLGSPEGSLGLARIYEKQQMIEEAMALYKKISTLDSIDDSTERLIRQRIAVLTQMKYEPGNE